MRAAVVTKHGSPDRFELQELPTPTPGPGEVCIRVSKAGINFADILSRMGLYPGAPNPPFTPGMEVSGTIHELGPDVKGLKKGNLLTNRSIGKFNNTELKSFSIEKSLDKATNPIFELVLSLNFAFIIADFIKKNSLSFPH